MSEDLILIHTYNDALAANAAQSDLRAAGIQSLLVSESAAAGLPPGASGVALAVHRRDAELAATVLSLGAGRGQGGTNPSRDTDRT